jgi:cell division transport system permease protein
MEALDEIGENPLLASLVMKARHSEQYQTVSDYLEKASFREKISRINYNKNKEIINKLNNIINQIERIGLILTLLFAGVSILIIFNTIRITIYVHKQEIEVMRLVGASNAFIRLPFMFEGMLYGIAAALLASGFLALAMKLIDPYAASIVSQSLFGLYAADFWMILGLQAAVGIFLGVVSSFIAMGKYLKI